MSDLIKTFTIEIGEGPAGCVANLLSYRDKKGVSLAAPSLRMLLHKITDHIRKQQSKIKRFPLPTDRLILTFDENKGVAPAIWVPK